MQQDLAVLARLLEYPGPDYPKLAAACPDFAHAAGPLSLARAQELYIQTFDWNPDTTLDISWHLFGENYDRGEFLVKMRGRLRECGLAESSELPDHLPLVLRLLERMPADEAAQFATQFVLPAAAKIAAALDKSSSAYVHLLRALERALAASRPEIVTTEVTHG